MFALNQTVTSCEEAVDAIPPAVRVFLERLLEAVVKCVIPLPSRAPTSSPTHAGLVLDRRRELLLPSSNASAGNGTVEDDVAICVIDTLFPIYGPAIVWLLEHPDIIEYIIKLLKFAQTDIFNSIVQILECGTVSLPAELILVYFGWARVECGKIIADTQWYYCLFAIGMFVIGVELAKLLSTRYLVWVSR